MSIKIKFKLKDFWIGVYWERSTDIMNRGLNIYICILPCIPIHIFVGHHRLISGTDLD